MFQNLATGQKLNTCDFFAYISSINWCSCTTDEVWLGNGTAKSGYDWFMYFQTNTPTCADQAPTCMAVHINDADQPGETLHVQNYPAIGIPTPSKTYQWQVSTDGVTWSPISGATSTSFVITNAEVGKYVRVQGTATNGVGSPAVCFSGAVPIVPANASPVNTIAPIISGGTTQGSTLTCTTGTWTGYPAPSFSFTWFANGVQVGTGSTYVLNLSDSLKNITCVVTANNGINPNGTATSNTITAGDYAPQNLTPPTISGGTTLGSTITCSVGSWIGTNITYNYAWFSSLTPVGDNSAQYQLQLTDTLANISCVVTAVNPAGSSSDISNTLTAGDFSPVNLTAPVISVIGGGPANPGTTIQTTNGTWQGSNITYSYQWYSGITPVGGNQTTYQVQNSDTGQNITCVVTATNLGGSASATSNTIAVPSGPGVTPPSNTTAPIITVASGGPVLAGKSLVCNVGVWLGTAPIIYTYEWFRGATSVGTGVSYTMVLADIGQPLKCVVTGTNAYGVASANSNVLTPTGQVSLPPSNIVAPMIYVANGGSALAGKVMTVDIGAWDGTSPINYSYQWFSGVTPVGVDDPSYLMQSSDIGNTITCVVTGTNGIGTANATSNGIPVIGTIYNAPINITPPSILSCGSATVGTCLSSSIGTWDGDDVVYSFEWFSGMSLVGILENYLLQPSDLGNNITLKVTATNPYGTAVATSSPVLCLPGVSAQRPQISIAPVISGNDYVGQTLTTTDGTWLYSPTSFAYQWYRGTTPIGSGTNTYTLVTADAGYEITCVVTASNTQGSEASTSNQIYCFDADFETIRAFAIGAGYTLPSTDQLKKHNQLLLNLKVIGFWARMDRIWGGVANDGSELFGRLNWKNPGNSTRLGLSPTPATWTPNLGYSGNGSSSFVPTQFIPATHGVNYKLDDAGRYFYTIQRTNFGAVQTIDGNTGINDNSMRIASTGTQHSINNGGTPLPSAVNASSYGFHAITRTNSSTVNRAIDFVETRTQGSTALSTNEQWILRSGSTYQVGVPVAFYALGASMTNAELLQLNRILTNHFNNL